MPCDGLTTGRCPGPLTMSTTKTTLVSGYMRLAACVFLCTLLLQGCSCKNNADKDMATPNGPLSGPNSIVYGPGMNPRIVTPARYVYIQAVDVAGKKFTSSPGKNAFVVTIVLIRSGKYQKLNAEIHDRGDGTFQIFYVFNVQPDVIKIDIKTQSGQQVGNTPVEQKMPEHESCYCPAPDPDDFSSQYGCRSEEPQLETDLQKFPIVSKDMVDKTLHALKEKNACFVHYVIRNKRIWAKAYGAFQGFKAYVDDVLTSLSRKVHLPDAEFVFNLGDWPQANLTAQNLPVFSWCGSNDTDDIVLPTYKMTLSTLFGKDMENVKDVDAKCHEVGGGWEKKINKMFWRGRDSNSLRTYFVDAIGPQNPQYLDVNISKNHFNYYPSDEDRQRDKRMLAGKKVDRVPFQAYWKYKYLLSIDGTVAAYRLPALLAGDSVVLKHDSKWYEHFYNELQPWVHYIPIKADMSDAMEKLHWARNHDKYSQLHNYVVQPPSGYEEVPHGGALCQCVPKPKRKKKSKSMEKNPKDASSISDNTNAKSSNNDMNNEASGGEVQSDLTATGGDWTEWGRSGLSVEL